MELSIFEQLSFSTIRIEAFNSTGQGGCGTGFFFNLATDDNHKAPLIITNKHVVEGLENGRFVFTEADSNGNPLINKHICFEIDGKFAKNFFPHPDPTVDLCALPLLPALDALNKQNKQIFFRSFDNSLIPTEDDINQFDSVEDVIMIGYPNGIWDQFNNMPIVRRGITATHIKYDYNGKKEFLIDAACFPGSSGSPVLLVNKGSYTDKMGNLIVGKPRMFLLGILYAGPQFSVTGDIKVINVPTIQKPVAMSHIPNNLGFIIKSSRIMDFLSYFKN